MMGTGGGKGRGRKEGGRKKQRVFVEEGTTKNLRRKREKKSPRTVWPVGNERRSKREK